MNEHLSLQELRKRPHWSFSRVNALINFCSLAWAFRYVHQQAPEFTPVSLVFGGVFHSALEYAFNEKRLHGTVPVKETAALFGDLLKHQIERSRPGVKMDEGQTLDVLRAAGQQMITVYLEQLDPEEKVLQVSVPFTVNLTEDGAAGETPLIGEFDCLVEKNGQVIILDWKTAAKRWPKDKAHTDLQPTCYLFAYAQATGGWNAKFRFDVVTKTKNTACEGYVTERTPDDALRLAQTLRVLRRRVWAEIFYPADQSWECRNCPYTTACRSWHRTAERTHLELKAAA